MPSRHELRVKLRVKVVALIEQCIWGAIAAWAAWLYFTEGREVSNAALALAATALSRCAYLGGKFDAE